jgi:hypothetical protein
MAEESATQNAAVTVAALAAEVHRLRDHEDIRQLLYRYARGVDRADLDLLCSVYHPDGTDHHGKFDGPGEAYARRLVGAEAGLTATGNHHITNIFIQLDGDEARAETYFLAFHPHRDHGSDQLGITSGRYLDRLVRHDGRWAILRREVVSDWTRAHLAGASWSRASAEGGGFIRGQRGHADASYGLFDR